MKRTLFIMSGTPLFLWVSTAKASADEVNEAVNALQNSNVAVASGYLGSNVRDLNAEFNGTKVGIVAVQKATGTATFDAPGIAQQALSRLDKYDTIIVVQTGVNGGKPAFGVASNTMNVNEIYSSLNANNNGDASEAILASTTEILTGTTTSTSTSNNNDGGMGGAIVGTGGALLAVALIVSGGIMTYKRFANRTKPLALTYDELPTELRKKLEEFTRIVTEHQAAGTTLAPLLMKMLTHAQDLFRRIDKRGNAHQKNMAAVSYVDTFTKLNSALSGDYYLDILANPNLWENSPGRLQEVAAAVEATDKQLIQNIREVNASQDLNLQVALEGLTRSMDDTTGELYQ